MNKKDNTANSTYSNTQHLLFVAEKPSLMREVQKCYKNHQKDIINKVGSIDFIALACMWELFPG